MDDDRLRAAEQERDAARAALRDAVHHLGRHHGCLHVTENPAMQAFYARAYGGDLSESFRPFGTMGRWSPQEIAAAEMREIVRASEQRADALRDRLVRFIAVDLYELGYDRDEAGWWHDQVALALGRIVLEFPIGADGVPLCDSARRAWEAVGERDGQLEQVREWSARWKMVATRYRRMLAMHRDRAAGREEG